MSKPLPAESLSSSHSVIGRRLVELALLPSLRGSPMSMPLPSERLKIPPLLRNEFSAPLELCERLLSWLVELA